MKIEIIISALLLTETFSSQDDTVYTLNINFPSIRILLTVFPCFVIEHVLVTISGY